MATAKQIELFNKLTGDKEFPAGTDLANLREQFAGVNDKSASDWIEKALALPDAGLVPPAF
jgi:hypothetical protein